MARNKLLILNLASLFILYFVQGMPYGLQSRYLPIIMRLNGVSLSELGLFKLLLIPWLLKFFIAAFLIDAYKSKRFWLVLSLSMLAGGSFLCSTFTNFHQIAVIMFGLNLASSIQDICVDWFAINVLDKENLGIGNTIQVAGYKAGTLFTGGLIVWFIDYINLQHVFILLGCIYLLSLFLLNLSLFNVELNGNVFNKKKDDNRVETVKMPLMDRLKLIFLEVPGTFWMCAFVVIYKLGEQSSLNMLPLYLIDNKVESSQIGLWTGVFGQVFSITGSILSGICLKKTHKKISTYKWLDGIIKLRIIPIVLLTVMVNFQETNKSDFNSSPFLLYSIYGLALVQLFLSGFLTTITFTLMMEISFSANDTVQATHYTLLATFEILGKLLIQPLISLYTDFYGYSIAFYLFSFLYLVCLICMKFYPRHLRV